MFSGFLSEHANDADSSSTLRRKRKFTVMPTVLASPEPQGLYLPLLNKFTEGREQ